MNSHQPPSLCKGLFIGTLFVSAFQIIMIVSHFWLFVNRFYNFSNIYYKNILLELVALDLAADGFGKFIAENNNTGILIRRGMLLNVVLNLFFEFLGRLRSLC